MTRGMNKKIGNVVTSLVLAILVAFIFYLAATQVKDSEGVDLIGGTVYSFVLSTIVFLAFVPRMRIRLSKRNGKKSPASGRS